MPSTTLPEFHHYTPQEGHPHWPAVREEAAALVEELQQHLNLAPLTPRERVQDAARIASALGATGVAAVKNRRRLRRGDHNLLPPYFTWTMHNTCNFRCTYCDNHQGEAYFNLPNKGRLNTEQGKQLLDTAGKDVRGIMFCGGEPTLRKDLPELVDHAWHAGYFPLMVNTNASRLHQVLRQENYRHWLRQMDVIVVSLDALTLEHLTGLWGVQQEQCQQVVVNLLALRMLQEQVRFKLIINTVITPETLEEANHLVDFANDMGIWFSAVPVNKGPTANAALMADPAYQALRQKILRRKSEGYRILGSTTLVRRLLAGDGLQCFPTLKPHIDIDGHLYWPCKTKSAVNPVKVNVLDFDSLDGAYRHAATLINPTRFHGTDPGQCGADCNWTQNYVSDLYGKGLSHPLRGGVLREIAEFVGAS